MTASAHPSEEILERFMTGRLESGSTRHVVRHLLGGCEPCREITTRHWEEIERGLRAARTPESLEAGPASTEFEGVLGRAMHRMQDLGTRLDRERREAPDRLQELLEQPQIRRQILIANSARFQTWALCKLLIERSYGLRFDDPRRGVELAELALAVAEELPVDLYSAALVCDFQARSWAYLGNSLRVVSDLRGAARAFRRAEKLLEEGSGDPLERARLLLFESILDRAQRRSGPSLQKLDRAQAIYRRFGEQKMLARVLLQKGLVYMVSGRHDTAVPLLGEALERFEADGSDRHRILAARHNLALCLAETGRAAEAWDALGALRRMHEELGDRINLIRLRWLEGRVLRGLERPDEAESALLEVRETFLDEEIGYDAALVSLDLASLYLEQGRSSEIRRLATEMQPIFASRDVDREAAAALIVFRRATEIDQVNEALLRELSAYLTKTRRGGS